MDRLAARLLLPVLLALQALMLYLPRVPAAPVTGIPGSDKVAHLAVFAAVTFVALRAGLPVWLVLGFGVLHAGVSEAVQHLLLPGRGGDVLDVVADLAGVALGALTARRAGAGRSRTGPARRGPSPSAPR